MRHALVVTALLVGAAGTARAHAIGPETSDTITFRQDHEQDIAAGTSFGVVLSHDGGATWEWMCEAALAYQWPFKPDYAYSQSGALFATSFDHPVVMRDACTFDPFGGEMYSTVTLGPDHALYLTAVGIDDAKIYKSTDDGLTFPITATAGEVNDWYSSLAVAPTDPSRVYVAGYRVESGSTRSWQLYKSTDGGETFAPMSTAGLTSSVNASMAIVAIEPGAPDTLYVRVDQADDQLGAALWRTTDAGATWTYLLYTMSPMANVLRANGDLVAATTLGGEAWISHDRGDHWTVLGNAPHIGCLVENAAGELWACTKNNDDPMYGPGDGAAIMKTTDLATWTKVLRYQDIRGPVACAAGTVQTDTCIGGEIWCPIVTKLGITTQLPMCSPQPADPVPEEEPPAGCCDTGGGSPGPSLLIAGIVAVLVRAGRSRRGAWLARR